jgi:hypothetical protein
MATAWIVDTPQVAKLLQKSLVEGDRAFAVGQARTGWRCARIVVMATMTQEAPVNFADWFDTFRCCLEPGGEIVYD